jgi:MurNAc alpha-1-phosphate uridylyltransferase
MVLTWPAPPLWLMTATSPAGRSAPPVRVQHEPELLETGGGVARALPQLGDEPFYVLNGDAYWLDGATPALTRLAQAFNPETMDALLLLVRTTQVDGSVGRGDFLMDGWGRLQRPAPHVVAPYIFAGIQILRPELVAPEAVRRFSLNRCYDSAAAAGRLFGLVHDGVWFHLSTPPDLAAAERRLESLAPEQTFAEMHRVREMGSRVREMGSGDRDGASG